MSVADLKAFGRKCGEDPALQKKAVAIGVTNMDGIIKLGRENGFNFSTDDLAALAREVAKTNMDMLDEKQLEAIAGGGNVVTDTRSLAVALAVTAAQASVGPGSAW